jgi:aspartate aminotransferase-like enzyme
MVVNLPMNGKTSFGPNAELDFHINLRGSHRDAFFRNQYRDTVSALKETYHLQDFDLLFLPGGGTLGVESVISSSRSPIQIVGCDGVFKNRWTEMADLYNPRKSGEDIEMSCHLETSVSQYQDLGTPILDVVSSFPYYSIPDTCDVFVLASNKQLNALAGLAIVGIRKSKSEKYFQSSELSYLSLSRYYESAAHDELPSTVGTYLFDSLLQGAQNFNLENHRSQIDDICSEFVNVFGAEMFVGDLRGPVLTIRGEAISREIATRWCLYEKPAPIHSFQIFTYSSSVDNYMRFLEEVRQAK